MAAITTAAIRTLDSSAEAPLIFFAEKDSRSAAGCEHWRTSRASRVLSSSSADAVHAMNPERQSFAEMPRIILRSGSVSNGLATAYARSTLRKCTAFCTDI
jgi:hypothetical protein